jgi:hypothetical protein
MCKPNNASTILLAEREKKTHRKEEDTQWSMGDY